MNAPLNASAALWPEHFYLIDAAGTQQHGLAGDASRDSMGSKAWNLLRMAQAGLPVPAALVVGTHFAHHRKQYQTARRG